MSTQIAHHRNYNVEYKDNDRKYSYDFDLILREYMMKSFVPFFPVGAALELGCFEGGMTELFSDYYDDLTVIEASQELIEIAQKRLGKKVKFIHSLFEEAKLKQTYDAIFLIHTLEHLDNPISVMQAINAWLTPTGRFF